MIADGFYKAITFDPYFGLDPKSEDAAKLRARQKDGLVQASVFAMATNLICLSFIFFFMKEQIPDWFLYPWSGSFCALILFSLYKSHKARKQNYIEKASVRAHKNAIRGAILFGLFWGSLPAIALSYVNNAHGIIICSILTGMMGGGTLSLYPIPRAMAAWNILALLGAIIGIFLSGAELQHVMISFFVLYFVGLCMVGHTMARTFAQNEFVNFELLEKTETVNLVLKDFSDNVSDWLWELDKNGKVIAGQSEFTKNLKAPFISIYPEDYHLHQTKDTGQSLNMRSLEELCQKFHEQTSFRDITIFSSGSEDTCWLSLSGKPVIKDGIFQGFRGVVSNISESKKAEERIAYLAHNDALTGLVNRARFNSALEDKLSTSNQDEYWCVLYLDLDGFKGVNDYYGHMMGDNVLGKIAARLKHEVAKGDIVARLGGDEFSILCQSVEDAQGVKTLSEHLVKSLSKPYYVKGATVEIGVSIGISIAYKDGNNPFTLLKNADLALYRAKAEGRGTYRFYKQEMDKVAKARRSLENDLRNALDNNELSLFYQPVISSKTGETTGFEALARWNHPIRGSISPDKFIPLAERIGVIKDIGEWVVHEACREASTWPQNFTISVNLSPQQFHDNKIIESVVNALKFSGLSPDRLELEITESLFLDGSQNIMFALRELKSMGVSIAMDDFGTGCSALSYLVKFPFDKLKIDRSFVSSINDDKNTHHLLEVLTKLGNALQVEITAEGVETSNQADVLRQMDCSSLQGFLYSKPLRTDQLSAYLLNEAKKAMKHKAANGDSKDEESSQRKAV